MSAIAACSPQHGESQQHLETIVGVGPVMGMAPTNTLERAPFRNADAFVALVIIARKIARAAWSIHHYHSTFNPERITQCLT